MSERAPILCSLLFMIGCAEGNASADLPPTQPPPAAVEPQVQPGMPEPTQLPPPPPPVPPPPPQSGQAMAPPPPAAAPGAVLPDATVMPPAATVVQPAPVAAAAPVAAPTGQWAYTSQYGWLWMPYAQNYSYVTADSGAAYAYVYYPTYGWRWIFAPWVLGWGPSPFWGRLGPARFAWYARPWFRVGVVHRGWGYGGWGRGGWGRGGWGRRR